MEATQASAREGHRELQALVKIEGEAWARRMQQLGRRDNRAARALDNDIAAPGRFVALIERRYDENFAEALACHESQPQRLSTGTRKKRRKHRVGRNLALRLRVQKRALLLFLTDLQVGFTSDEAERDLWMMKQRQKFSGGFRSAQGAENFAILRSLITTARKQNWEIIEALTSPSDRLVATVKCA